MCAVVLTEIPGEVSPLVQAAALGDLPSWSRVSPKRREHIERVAALMREWARALRLPPEDRTRWAAAAYLHDALRDADEGELRDILDGDFRDLPHPLLHGPAAAKLLAGHADEALRRAVRYHTLGHPELDRMGRALYLADFLEPGRDFEVEWRESLRERMPAEQEEVLLEVVGSRICELIRSRKPIRPETAAFWTALVRGR